MGLLPLLGGCSAAFLVSCAMMRHSIMTEKIARRGVKVHGEYSIDFLSLQHVGDHARRPVVTLRADDTLEAARARVASLSHQGFPVVDGAERLIGVLTRRDLANGDGARQLRQLVTRPPTVIFDDSSLREAADQMARAEVGRLPVVTRADPLRVIGILTRSDLVAAHARRLEETHEVERGLNPEPEQQPEP
jgi:CBS domain-containing protein